ncbi:hypothetical protein TNCV_3645981 [Trichonephila clavipes]|nr:hypothetical protein TNCV_3645981 [Trichonephila clavipes]
MILLTCSVTCSVQILFTCYWLTPVSPLPPTPVASPSHEPSQDVIYDSLPTMEQSTVSEPPLKDLMEPSRLPESPLKDTVDPPIVSKLPVVSKPPVVSKSPMVSKSPHPLTKKTHVKKVDSVIHRSPRSRGEGMRKQRGVKTTRDPRLYRADPISEPPYQRPRVFRRPLMHVIDAHFPGKCKVFFHWPRGFSRVVCIRNSGFTLTNGVISSAMDRECPHDLFKFLHYLNVRYHLCHRNQHSKQTFKDIQADWSSSRAHSSEPL